MILADYKIKNKNKKIYNININNLSTKLSFLINILFYKNYLSIQFKFIFKKENLLLNNFINFFNKISNNLNNYINKILNICNLNKININFFNINNNTSNRITILYSLELFNKINNILINNINNIKLFIKNDKKKLIKVLDELINYCKNENLNFLEIINYSKKINLNNYSNLLLFDGFIIKLLL